MRKTMTYVEGYLMLINTELNRDTRLALLRENHTPEVATIIDDAFCKAMKGVLTELGGALDELNFETAVKASDYVLQGVIVNLNNISDVILQRALEQALANGEILAMGGGGPTPGCDCEVCTARRLSEENADRTVH